MDRPFGRIGTQRARGYGYGRSPTNRRGAARAVLPGEKWRDDCSGGQHTGPRNNPEVYVRGAFKRYVHNKLPRMQPGLRPERKMGFQYVENLVNNEDIQQVMLQLSNERSGFAELLDSKEISNDMLILLTKLLSNICDTSFLDIKINLLTTALRSRFMEKLQLFVTNIINQSDQDKKCNKYFWKDQNQFWNCLIKLAKTVQELIPTCCESIQKLLKTVTLLFPLIDIPDEIKAQMLSLLDIIEKTVQHIEVKKRQPQNVTSLVEDEEPPDDFRQIKIIPSAQEIVTEHSPFLRANIIDRPFSNVDQYLDIQFRLLREDFVAPLRRGINTFLSNENKPRKDWTKLEDIKIYNPVVFLTVETVNECNCYKIKFDFSKKKRSFVNENSKKFMFGSLVCFTRDKFKTLLFGKIVQRDVQLLEQGLLIVGFMEDVEINFEAEYLMVESSVYFEPYYQVLGVLQRMNADSFPMEKYIIDVHPETRPPEYLLQTEPVFYKVQNSKFWPLNFLSNRFHNLNDSQLDAFKAALTNEFSIIQGPPGTGKTFLGLRIAHTLLANLRAWYHRTPILVICYTNHALDQFLEGLLVKTDKILRVGGQSKNEKLKNYNMVHKRRIVNHQAAVHQKRNEIQDYMQQQKTLSEVLNIIHTNESVLSFHSFEEVVEDYTKTWFARATFDEMRRWLLEGKSRNAVRARNEQREARQAIENMELTEDAKNQLANELHLEDDPQDELLDDIFHGISIRSHEPLLSLSHLQDKLRILQQKLFKTTTLPESLANILLQEQLREEVWETQTDLYYLLTQFERFQDKLTWGRLPDHYDLHNPFKMRYDDRWQLYYYWLSKYFLEVRRKYKKNGIIFQRQYRIYKDMREIEDTQLMKDHLVVGMTTTGAARLQASLQELRSPIVIVEEAAEVLEAHIVAALTKDCQHLILIGDHLQLKPSAADFKIQTKFKLGISLFERMVRNNIECHTLNVQHRMRPEISNLVKPHIYPELKDHESTLQRAPILGVEKCLYFIDHQQPEELCQDASKKNIHESKFLIALARHLVLNGYKPEQITILAAYLGQYFEMAREKRKDDNRLLLQDVRIAVLDNYQGEESDIVLLSLVRNNKENKAGFLRIQNRVCVALSRARDGFYIMGNMSLLLQANSENQIWQEIKEVLEKQEAIGTHLTLRCQIHQHKITRVSTSQDFVRISEGGCDLLCEAQLGCGHRCKRLCHVQDRAHEMHKCGEKCLQLLCNDATHVCKKLCYEECGPCTYLVLREFQCGHTVNIECHIDPAKYECKIPIWVKLPCEHETQIPCSADPNKFTCPFPCDSRVEPCGHSCDRLCHIRVDPDHLEYKCRKKCAKPCVGCRMTEDKHVCSRFCFEDCEECNVGVKEVRSCGHAFVIPCKSDIEEVECMKPCKQILPCGHACLKKCCEDCEPCTFLVEKRIPDCLHVRKIMCHQAPVRSMCKSKTCPRLLPCGHKCTRYCKEPCTDKCNEMVDCNIPAPCGHNITRIMCSMKNTNDPKTLLQLCTQPCNAELSCKHKCTGTCGKCMQSRIHQRCTAKCGVPLVCNHECPIPCREACKPCTRNCEMKCRHSKCKKKCGEPCTPCRNVCPRSCPHVRCSRLCGDICDVRPCVEKCRRRLKCGHGCVGFCGDPCPPLCRICNEADLTELLFGTEDEEDAIFVLLKDCGHVLEHSGLEQWLNEGNDRIQFKTCPKCKSNITTTERYSDYVKQAIKDVVSAKQKSFGQPETNEALRKMLTKECLRLKIDIRLCDTRVSLILHEVLTQLQNRLEPIRHDRRQPINWIELNAIRSKFQTMRNIIECFEGINTRTAPDSAVSLVNVLIRVLLRSEDHVTNQEIDDLEMEIKRLHRIIQFSNIEISPEFRCAQVNPDIQAIYKNIQQTLFADERYTNILDNAIKINYKELTTKVKCTVNISDKERIEIVKAIGLEKGHWYKCPNGHPYAIGECGGANQVAKCLCGEKIGGTDHHLLATNRFAGEMDGATRHAWPGGLY